MAKQQGPPFAIVALWPLGLLLIALKLFSAIDWSWWWVTLPFWGPWASVLAFIGFGMIIALLFSINPFDT